MQKLRRRKHRRGTAGSDDGSTSTSEEEPEQFEQMNPIFRLVTLYEMLIYAQWQYVCRFHKNRKPELVIGIYIGSLFELIRFVCVLTLGIVLILMRISFIVPLQSDVIVGNLTWIGVQNSFAFWCAIILCVAIVVQFAVYQCKSPPRVVLSTAFNFVFSVLLVCSVIHLAVLRANSEAFIKEGLLKKVLVAPKTMSTLANFETRMRCCGIDGPNDYSRTHILNYVNPLTNKTEQEPLTREWAVDEHHVFYSLPISCCARTNRGICSQRNVTSDEFAELNAFKNAGQWDMMLKYFTLPEKESYHQNGCVLEFTQSLHSQIYLLLVTLVIFSIFTAFTVGFVIVYLLYHDGVGHMVSEYKMFGVERNTAVHFLMNLDFVDNGFQDDFSIIEFMRKSDLDNFIAEDKVNHPVMHRREVES